MKDFAFVAVITDDGAKLGMAIENVSGHANFLGAPEFQTYSEAQDRAEELNTNMGLTESEAWKIVASTLR